MRTYKLRAECLNDVMRLIKILPVFSYSIDCKMIPDVEFTFSSDYTLDDIKSLLKTHETVLPDSHVMLETVTLEKDYTGERVRS